jgi:hypothetical protein
MDGSLDGTSSSAGWSSLARLEVVAGDATKSSHDPSRSVRHPHELGPQPGKRDIPRLCLARVSRYGVDAIAAYL